MDYPAAVLEKAQRLEQLLLQVAAGAALDEANRTWGFALDPEQLARCQARYETGGRTWEALLDGRHGHARKTHSELREWLWARKQEDEGLRAPHLVREVQQKFGVTLSDGHINYLLRQRGLTAPPGRPYKKPPPGADTPPTPAAPSAAVENAGIFFPGSRQGRDGPR